MAALVAASSSRHGDFLSRTDDHSVYVFSLVVFRELSENLSLIYDRCQVTRGVATRLSRNLWNMQKIKALSAAGEGFKDFDHETISCEFVQS